MTYFFMVLVAIVAHFMDATLMRTNGLGHISRRDGAPISLADRLSARDHLIAVSANVAQIAAVLLAVIKLAHRNLAGGLTIAWPHVRRV
jgi:hypothetical protein